MTTEELCRGKMCEKMVDTLLQHGLIINPKDVDNPGLLNTAVEKRYLKIVEDLLKYGADVNKLTTSRFGRCCTPLHSAVCGKQVEMAQLLINYGANVNVNDSHGKTPLFYAIHSRNAKLTELLLTNGAYIHDPQLLYTTINNGDLKITEYLLKYGADVNMYIPSKFTREATLQHIAFNRKQVEMVKLLINYGANVNIKDAKGITPLVCAIKTQNTKMIELLLSNGADIKGDPNLLCTAVEYKCLKVTEELLKDGADANTLFGSSITLLDIAVNKEHVEMAQLLIKYGANVNIKDTGRITPLVRAIQTRNTKMIELLLINGANIKEVAKVLCIAVECGCLKVVEDLLKDGADVNMFTTSRFRKCRTLLHSAPPWRQVGNTSNFERKMTLLHIAVNKQDVEMAQLLIKYGANVNIKDAGGITPLVCAIQTRNTKMIELLLINGVDIEEVSEVLCIAVEYGCFKLVDDLLNDGADVNILTTSRFGGCCTLLHIAVCGKQVEMAQLLINYGANVNIKGAKGISPLVSAIETGNTKMIELLLNNGADVKGDPEVLCIAAENGCFKLVEDLLKDGADVNMLTTSRFGECWTPLYSAVRGKQVKIAKLLINYGANINVERPRGESLFSPVTPLHDAIENRDPKMIELLLFNGADIIVNLELQYKNSENIRLVRQHIAKAKAAGLHLIVSERNLLRSNDHEMNNFLNRCKAEIEIMKSEMIDNSCFSFYDILTKDISQSAKNERIVRALKLDDYDYKKKFPIYASMIDSRFRRLVERVKLLEQVRNKFLHSFCGSLSELPFLCTEKIFSYLSDKDLRILLAA